MWYYFVFTAVAPAPPAGADQERPHRPGVRTRPFQGRDPGSNPGGDASLRSPPACRSPRGASAGQASLRAKAAPPKLQRSEGGPMLPAFAPLRPAALLGELRPGKPAFGRRLPRRSCNAAKAGQCCQPSLPSGLPLSSGSFGRASQPSGEGCPAEAATQRRRANAASLRSPPACRSPRGASAGQASLRAKAAPPKLRRTEGGPVLPDDFTRHACASQRSGEDCPAHG